MADYKVTDTQLSGIANAIRSKGGTSEPLAFPSEFISAIGSIQTGGNYGSLSVSQNGTYTPSAPYDAFDSVVVNVQGGGGGGSNDNFKIAVGAMSGSIYDTEITSMQKSAFRAGGGINSAVLGVEMTALESIPQDAFYDCRELLYASFPACTYIGNNAFRFCIKLSEARFPLCSIISDAAFSSCASLASISFPLCESIGISTFYGCKSLTEAIFSVCTSLNAHAFSGCTKLATISIPVCSYIGSYAFGSCTSLAEVSLPVCMSIYPSAFNGCNKLASVYMLSTSVASLGNTNAFNGTPMSNSSYLGHFGSIYVPSSLVDSYKAANNWSVYSDRITAYIE